MCVQAVRSSPEPLLPAHCGHCPRQQTQPADPLVAAHHGDRQQYAHGGSKPVLPRCRRSPRRLAAEAAPLRVLVHGDSNRMPPTSPGARSTPVHDVVSVRLLCFGCLGKCGKHGGNLVSAAMWVQFQFHRGGGGGGVAAPTSRRAGARLLGWVCRVPRGTMAVSDSTRGRPPTHNNRHSIPGETGSASPLVTSRDGRRSTAWLWRVVCRGCS